MNGAEELRMLKGKRKKKELSGIWRS